MEKTFQKALLNELCKVQGKEHMHLENQKSEKTIKKNNYSTYQQFENKKSLIQFNPLYFPYI